MYQFNCKLLHLHFVYIDNILDLSIDLDKFSDFFIALILHFIIKLLIISAFSLSICLFLLVDNWHIFLFPLVEFLVYFLSFFSECCFEQLYRFVEGIQAIL